jgi:hypothetical protein
MHSTSVLTTTAALLVASTVLAAPASEKRAGQTIAVSQVANPKFQGTSGILAAARAYSKFKKPFPKGLKNAVDKQFPGWGKVGFQLHVIQADYCEELSQQTLEVRSRGFMTSTILSQH